MIVEFRRAVFDALGSSSIPVHLYQPDDVAHVPCHVVGRVSVREASTPAIVTLELLVTLLGRRITDEDAQAQLDALGDELIKVLGGTRHRDVNGLHLRLTAFDPATTSVAGLDLPAYVATVVTESVSC